MGFREIKGKH